MAIYSVDVRDGMIQRVTLECHKAGYKRFFLIEAGSAKQYSGYWIYQGCRELNRRVQNVHLKAGV